MGVTLTGALLFADGREAALTDAGTVSLSIEAGADGALLPGAVLSATCTLELADPDGTLHADRVLIGATMAPVLTDGTARTPLGCYRVESAARREKDGVLVLKGGDALSFELGGAITDAAVYPATLGTIMRMIVSQTRLSWDGVMPNANAVIDFAPEWGEITLRRALSLTACAAGAYATLDGSGALKIRPVWDEDGEPRALTPRSYLSLEADGTSFGPADALILTTTVGEDEEIEPVERVFYATAERTRVYPLSVSENPLLREGAPHLSALAQGMVSGFAGLCGHAMSIEALGCEGARVGEKLLVSDLNGDAHAGVLSRLTLRYDGILRAGLVCRPPEADESGVMRVFTKEGGLNAAALTGTVRGSLLSAASVTTAKLAAGSVTAEKLSAGAVTADKLAAGAVDAGAVSAVTAKIAALTSQSIRTDSLGAALVNASVLSAGAGSFDSATVKHLVSSVFNLDGQGTATDVFIENLRVRYAQLVSATLGTLVLRASDGRYYRIDVQGGQATATDVTETLSEGEIAAGITQDKRAIVETEIDAGSLSAGDFKAQTALVNRLYAAFIDADELCARQAFVDSLRTLRISPRSGSSLTLSAMAGDFEQGMRLTRDGDDFYVDIGRIDEGSVARLSADGLQLILGGAIWSSFASQYVQFGNYRIRQSADGGLVFGMGE